VLSDECDASFLAGRTADRFGKAYCGKAVELADAAAPWLNVRELAQRRLEASQLALPEGGELAAKNNQSRYHENDC